MQHWTHNNAERYSRNRRKNAKNVPKEADFSIMNNNSSKLNCTRQKKSAILRCTFHFQLLNCWKKYGNSSLTRKLSYLYLLAVLVGCQWQEAQNTTKTRFIYNEGSGLQGLDPIQMGYKTAVNIGSQIYNGLVEYTPKGSIGPMLATTWNIDSTGLVWTFDLRQDVYFHEDSCFGKKKTRRLTAYDVQYSFERLCNATTRSTGAWVLRDKIMGAKEYFDSTKSSTTYNGHIGGIIVLDSFRVQLQLVKPYSPLLAVLTMPYCYIVPREAVEYYGEDFFKHPIGTGPYRFVSWFEDRFLTLVRNDRYFESDSVGTKLPYIDSVTVLFIRDARTSFLEFRQGKIDLLLQVEPSFLPVILDSNGFLRREFSQKWQYFSSPAFTVEYYGILLDSNNINAKSVPLAKTKLLRQALNYAIDREKIVKYVLQGRGVVAHQGVIPPGMLCFSDSVRGYKFNKKKAEQLLQQAGYPSGKGLPSITLQIGLQQSNASVAEAIQQMWSEIGIEVEIVQRDFPQHLAMVRAGKLPLWRTSWIGDYPDPENFMALFYSEYKAPAGPNTTHFQSAKFDSLFAKALEPLITEQERCKLYEQMEALVIEEAPWIFLYYEVVQRLVQKNITGILTDGNDKLVLKYVKK